MKRLKTFEQFSNKEFYDTVNSIMESEMTNEEIDNLLEEGFFSWLKNIFSNPRKKRELDKLAAKLVQTRVEIAKIDIQEDDIEALETELEDKTDPYTNPKAKGSKFTAKTSFDDNDPTQIKKAQLEKLEEEILDGMDKIGEENETLAKYVTKVKLDSRIESTEQVMKLADAQMRKVLSKLHKKDQMASKSINKELQDELG